MDPKKSTMEKLEKIIFIKIKKIKNCKGNLYKIINKLSPYYRGIGEVYLSEIKKNIIKGWNLHKKNYSVIFLVQGSIIFYYKYKSSDKYKKKIIKFDDYKLILIPPNFRYAFKGLDKKNSLINFMDKIYNPNESFKENFLKNQ